MPTFSAAAFPAPPVAKKVPSTLSALGRTRTDEYFWLRDRNDPDTIPYLEAENRYFESVMQPLRALEERLYQEMLARIQETDLSVPVKKGDFRYYTRTEQGKQYPYYCRKQGEDAPEQLLLDCNDMAEGKDYFRLGNFAVSPDHELLAYSVDNEGDEVYETRVKRLSDELLLPDVVPDTYYGIAWTARSGSFFYIKQDEAKRPYRVWLHRLGTDVSEDTLIFEETDERFHVTLDKTSDERYVLIKSDSFTCSEVRLVDALEPESTPVVVLPRREQIEYDVDHRHDLLYVRINDKGPDFRLVRGPLSAGEAGWEELIPNREHVMLEGFQTFEEYLVVSERDRGLERIRIHAFASNEWHAIEFPEPAYSVFAAGNAEFETHVLRFQYQSLVTPSSVFEYDMRTRERKLLKQQPVLGGYDASLYASERLFATSADGEQIPVSLVYKKGLVRDGSAPCYLYGYGSYGISSDPYFDSDHLSLLDRGFVYAIAHIRGGGDLGKRWHDAGKLLVKKRTFEDFIAAADMLVSAKFTSPDRLVAMGGSAGGMLMGAVMNLRPELWRVIVAHVPFVDVLNTAQDPTLPLTIGEYEEWGNTNVEQFFDYVQSYSPYDNVQPARYPHVFVTAGLNDPRVSYWEPAKWVAKLRTCNQGDSLIVLKTNMSAGHSGRSGRYEALRETAEEYAFVLAALGLEKISD